ncbi:hypothetical protein TNCV_510601 [Trichonephila clavipes]|nr:hypothetical protein TNCV_510601 [Trichonephila clavipes]
MKSGWSAQRVARHLSRSDFTVRKFLDQWTEEMSFTRYPSPKCPQQTSRQEVRHIIQHSRVEPTAFCCCSDTGSTFITDSLHRKAPDLKTSSIAAPIMCVAYDTHSPTPPFGVVSCTMGLDYNGMELCRLQRRI